MPILDVALEIDTIIQSILIDDPVCKVVSDM